MPWGFQKAQTWFARLFPRNTEVKLEAQAQTFAIIADEPH
jgi:hypothetical protein